MADEPEQKLCSTITELQKTVERTRFPRFVRVFPCIVRFPVWHILKADHA